MNAATRFSPHLTAAALWLYPVTIPPDPMELVDTSPQNRPVGIRHRAPTPLPKIENPPSGGRIDVRVYRVDGVETERATIAPHNPTVSLRPLPEVYIVRCFDQHRSGVKKIQLEWHKYPCATNFQTDIAGQNNRCGRNY